MIILKKESGIMKKAICRWSFPDTFSIKRCMELARKAGFDGIELVLDKKSEITLSSSKKDMIEVRKIAEKIGIEVTSLATLLLFEYSLTSPDSNVREKAKSIVKKMLKLGSYLGVNTILINAGFVDIFFKPEEDVVSYDLAYERALESLNECVPLAEELRINIGVENVWNKFLLSPLEMRTFIDEFNSEYIGVYFDVANVLLTGYPEQWIEILGKRIKKVHVKDFKKAVGNINGFVGLLEGDVDWKKVIEALNKIHYDDYLVAEVPLYSCCPEALIYNTSKSMDCILRGEW